MTPFEACPELSEIEQLVDERLAPEASARIRTHVTTCRTCSEHFDELRADHDLGSRLRRALGGMNDERLPNIEGYRVVREVGRGGMGVVYEAEQESPRRRVALKVVRGAQFVDAQTLRLFQREIRVLARLEHPGIASLYDAGETGGEHWFSMEFVDGRPISEHARALDVDTKLERFLQVCDAIEHAHRQGVVHRDLKPSNVLVTGAGRVQVLDFGLAKITDSDVSFVTEAGHIRGTLAYMSPEQAYGDPTAIGLSSDVYSLGVILYELLCDALPIDTSGVPIHEAARRITQEAPRRPSAIDPSLRGDLETIVLKALEKDPHRRYAGAAALAEDVRRFRRNEVILARPPSAAYEFRKLVARHRLPFALAAVVVFGAVGTAIWTALLYRRESESLALQQQLTTSREAALVAEKSERERAEKATREAQEQQNLAEKRLYLANQESSARSASLEFLVEIFRDVRTRDAGAKELTATELLKRGIARMDQRKDDSSFVRIVMLATVGEAALKAGLRDDAARLLEEGLALARRDQPGTALLGSILASLGLLRGDQGRQGESLELLRESEQVFAASQGNVHANSIQARLNLARGLRESGNPTAALEILRELLPRTEASDALRGKRAGIQVLIGLALYDLFKLEDAATLLTAAITEHEAEGPSVDLASLHHTLGTVHFRAGRLDEALERVRTALDMRLVLLPPDDEALSFSYAALAAIAKEKREWSVAIENLEKATAISVRLFGRESVQVANHEFSKARVLIYTNDLAGAQVLAEHALDVRRAILGADHQKYAESLVLVGELAAKGGRWSRAEECFREASKVFDVKLGRPHPLSIQARFKLVQCLVDTQRVEEARALFAELQESARNSRAAREVSRSAPPACVLAEGVWFAAGLIVQGVHVAATGELRSKRPPPHVATVSRYRPW